MRKSLHVWLTKPNLSRFIQFLNINTVMKFVGYEQAKCIDVKNGSTI
jgi:hypothetical protein